MSKKAIYLPIIIAIVFGALLLGTISSCSMPATTGVFGDRIGLLYIEGVIMSGSGDTSLFNPTGGVTSDHIVEVVNQAIDDTGIKALVVRINSPGGSAAASQEIYAAFKKFSDTGRPVIVSMGDVAASGGYYIASIADEIYANPATLTGSIGVIFDLLNYEGLFNILGLSANTITAGEFKDIGSPTRPMTDEERQMLQDMLNQVHQQFKDAVKEGRGFTDQEINDIATGMIFNGEDALKLKLIDKLGGLNDAMDRAAELSGLPKGYTVDHLGKTGLLDQLMSDLGGVSAPNPGNNAIAGALGQVIGAQQNPFYKLWSVILLDPRVAGENAGIQY